MSSTSGPKLRMNIWGYLDETGSLRGQYIRSGPIFGMGFLICPRPHDLHRKICDLRSTREYKKEFKFEYVNEYSIPIYKELLDCYFVSHNSRFAAEIYKRTNISTANMKNKDINSLYNRLASRLIGTSLDKGRYEGSDYIAIIADDISTPIDDKFETEIRERLKRRLRRNALFGMSRAESHAFTELQLCDVLLGTVAYAFKLEHSLIRGAPKPSRIELVKHLQQYVKEDRLAKNFVSTLRYGQRFEVKDRFSEKIIK